MELQTRNMTVLAFIFAHVFTLTGGLISSYSFRLPSSVPHCNLKGSLQHFLYGKSSDNELAQILLI